MKTYRILFSLESLMDSMGNPRPAAATIYNMIAVQSMMLGRAITDTALEDPIPFVEVFTERPESERQKTSQWLHNNDLVAPRKLLMGSDDIGQEQIMAVFDDHPERVRQWRAAGAVCYQTNEVSLFVLQ